MYFMSDPQALHVTRNVIPGKLGVDLHLHRVHIPLVTIQFFSACSLGDRKVIQSMKQFCSSNRRCVVGFVWISWLDLESPDKVPAKQKPIVVAVSISFESFIVY